MAVGQYRVGEQPEMFSGLQLGRIRRQEKQVDVLGHAELDARMPARAIQDQDDLLAWAGTDLTCERRQFDLEERNRDTRREVKDGPARGGMHEPHHIAPVVAMLDRGGRALPVEAPDLLEDGFQPDAVLVGGPELDRRLREGGRDRLGERADLFLNSACCSGSASTWRGRGLRRLPSRRTR